MPLRFYRALGRALSGLALFGLAAQGAFAQTASDPAVLYHNYCSVCHGDRGDGKSRATGALSTVPRDFTSAAAKQELTRDFRSAIDFDQSTLFKKVYEEEFGTFGGSPFGALIGDFDITRRVSGSVRCAGASSVRRSISAGCSRSRSSGAATTRAQPELPVAVVTISRTSSRAWSPASVVSTRCPRPRYWSSAIFSHSVLRDISSAVSPPEVVPAYRTSTSIPVSSSNISMSGPTSASFRPE